MRKPDEYVLYPCHAIRGPMFHYSVLLGGLLKAFMYGFDHRFSDSGSLVILIRRLVREGEVFSGLSDAVTCIIQKLTVTWLCNNQETRCVGHYV